MKIAWICDTMYQILNCINYVLNKRQDGCIYDLYIGHQFIDDQKIENKLKRMGIFHKVIAYIPFSNKRGCREAVKRTLGILSPKYRIKSMLLNKADVEFISDTYDIIFMSIYTHFSVSLAFMTNAQKIYYYDDGIGSYIGDIFSISKEVYRRYALFGYDLNRILPDRIYLNNTKFCKSNINCQVFELPNLMDNSHLKMKFIEDVFEYKNKGYYKEHRVIYLSQPNDNCAPDVDELEIKMLGAIKNILNNILIRPHPRQNADAFEGYSVDIYRNCWELICIDQISSEHILIGCFSTSQIMPKLIVDKEPYLIFTYRLFSRMFTEKQLKEFEDFIQFIRTKYRNRNKIFVVNTINELVEYLNTL